MRTVLALVNFVFFIVGLAIAGAGGILIWGTPLVRSLLSEVFRVIQSTLATTLTINDVLDFIFSYSNKLGVALLVIGLIVGAIAFFGFMGGCCCCGCCCNRIFLIIYIIPTTVILLAEVVAVIVVVASPKIETDIKALLFTTLQPYTGRNSTNAETFIWNFVMPELNCCGVNNGTDFDTLTQWDKRIYVNKVAIPNSESRYPFVCCKLNTRTYEAIDSTCPTIFNTINSNFETGCYSALKDLVILYGKWVLIGVGCAAGFQLLLIIMAGFVIRDFAKVTPV